MPKSPKGHHRAVAVDLFCGAGGLTHGLVKAGVPVVAGIDLDPACRYPYEANNRTKFILRDIADVSCGDLLTLYPTDCTRILVGCAPCQPFSRYTRRQDPVGCDKWGLLEHFSRLVEETSPTVVSMENVPELAQHQVFQAFIRRLRDLKYHVSFSKVFCPGYGIPQVRSRLVLLASSIGSISLLPPTHRPSRYRTVKQAISKLPRLSIGGVDAKDPLHRACRLSDLNLRRIRVSQPGGCWRDWPKELIAECHRSESGKTYPSVYGRMEWNKPAPTITTQFFGFGNGRFGHPEQDRAISLREGAILQSFPKNYQFCQDTEKASFSVLGRLIGNAVPVRLGEIIGKTILKHITQDNGEEY